MLEEVNCCTVKYCTEGVHGLIAPIPQSEKKKVMITGVDVSSFDWFTTYKKKTPTDKQKKTNDDRKKRKSVILAETNFLFSFVGVGNQS